MYYKSIIGNTDVSVYGTGSTTLTNSIPSTITSARFMGWARKGTTSKNLIGQDTKVLYPVDIKSGDTYSVTKANGTAESDVRKIFFYDENKNFISDLNMSSFTTRTLTYPSGRTTAKYIGWSTDQTQEPPLMMFNMGQPLPYEPYSADIIKPSDVVESSNRNLADRKKIKGNYYINDANYNYKISSNSGTELYRISVEQGKTYTLSWKGYGCIRFEDNNENLVSGIAYSNMVNGRTFTVPNGATVVAFSPTTNTEVQLEIGSVATEYIEHKDSSIQLPYTPLGIGNIKDELVVYANGSGKLIKRVGSIVLNGTQSFTKSSYTTEELIAIYTYLNDIKRDCVTIADRFEYGVYTEETAPTECIGSSGEAINIRMLISRVGGSTINDVKNYFANNPTEVLYELATPTEIPLTAEQVAQILNLKTFDNVTFIEADFDEFEVGYYVNSNVGRGLADIRSMMLNQLEELSEIIVGLN